MTSYEIVFPCLSCGADTGCANRLVCEKCRSGRRLQRAGALAPGRVRRDEGEMVSTPLHGKGVGNGRRRTG
jgi:hypothetical protein